jgi:hypothetical protein
MVIPSNKSRKREIKKEMFDTHTVFCYENDWISIVDTDVFEKLPQPPWNGVLPNRSRLSKEANEIQIQINLKSPSALRSRGFHEEAYKNSDKEILF